MNVKINNLNPQFFELTQFNLKKFKRFRLKQLLQQCRLYDVGPCFEHIENEVLLRKRLDVALSQVPTCVGLLQVCSVLVQYSAVLN